MEVSNQRIEEVVLQDEKLEYETPQVVSLGKVTDTTAGLPLGIGHEWFGPSS